MEYVFLHLAYQFAAIAFESSRLRDEMADQLKKVIELAERQQAMIRRLHTEADKMAGTCEGLLEMVEFWRQQAGESGR